MADEPILEPLKKISNAPEPAPVPAETHPVIVAVESYIAFDAKRFGWIEGRRKWSLRKRADYIDVNGPELEKIALIGMAYTCMVSYASHDGTVWARIYAAPWP